MKQFTTINAVIKTTRMAGASFRTFTIRGGKAKQ